MRKFKLIHILFMALALTFMACQSSQESEENTETAEEVMEAEAPMVVLNANLASKEELAEIGLPEAFIQKIVDARPFLTMNDFDAIVGADWNKENLFGKIFVPFNLNTTAEADFKMIPGVGDRMAHEFEEYRPYTSIQQFRKEIGKYVADEEVARYENYVFVPVELNSASEEDIKALPGVGDRMAHEFEEYRPYQSMEQFRKEIGKYVDDKELARLERFVYLSVQ